MQLEMKLGFFTEDESFPLFIQYGLHDGADMAVHSHADFSELVIVLSGKAEHIADGKKYAVKHGDAFVVGGTMRHGYQNAEHLRICNIMFRPEALLAGEYDIKQSAGFHELFLLHPYAVDSRFSAGIKLDEKTFSAAEEIITAAVNEYNGDKPGRKTMVLSLFLQLVTMLSRVYSDEIKPSEINSIADAAAFMEANYTSQIALDQLLSLSHYSLKQLSRYFKDNYHTTPKQYLLSIRMKHAAELLQNSTIPIWQVALQCGIEDANYFTRLFKKHYGISPKDFR